MNVNEIFRMEQMCFGDSAWGVPMLTAQFDSDFSVHTSDRNGYAFGMCLGAGEFELYRIGIIPVMRGRGAGLDLLSRFHGLCFARGGGERVRIFLEVCEDNTHAIALYNKAGYAETGRRGRYYGERGAILMECICDLSVV